MRCIDSAERQPSFRGGPKLPSGWYPGPPISLLRGGLAQLVEHLLCKQGVNGSSPLSSTRVDH